jgi:hypothetical protein
MDLVTAPAWNVDVPLEDRKSGTLAQLTDWIRSERLAQLASAWAETPPARASTAELYAWYDEISGRHWDFRQGRERNLAAAASLADEQVPLVMATAEQLGLVTPAPPLRDHYDAAIILGGLVRACVTRPRFARELRQARVRLDKIIALGGFRPLGGDEVALAERLGVDAVNEFGAMVRGVQGAFQLDEKPQVTSSTDLDQAGNSDWARALFKSADIEVLAAPSRDPDTRRANTADTFAWWASTQPPLTGKHILMITSTIYVPYQGAAAIENLAVPFDVAVETVGVSLSSAELGEDTQVFAPANYLQEIRSAVLGYGSLYRAVSSL